MESDEQSVMCALTWGGRLVQVFLVPFPALSAMH